MTYFSSNEDERPSDFWPPYIEAYDEQEMLRLVLLGAAVEAADSPYSSTAIATAAEDSFYSFLQKRDEHMREKGGEEEFRIGYETAIEDKKSEEKQLDDEIRNSLKTIADLRAKLYDRTGPVFEDVKARLHSLKTYEDSSASELEKWAYEDGVKMTVSQALDIINSHERLIQDQIDLAQRAVDKQDSDDEEEEDDDA